MMLKGTQTNQLAVGDFTGSPPPGGSSAYVETDSQFDIIKKFGTDGSAYLRFRLKDFNHLMPPQDVSDSIGGFQHNESDNGGLRMWGFSNGLEGLRFVTISGQTESTNTALSRGAIRLQAYKRDLADPVNNAGQLGASDNLVTIYNGDSAVAFIKGDGSYQRIGGGGSPAVVEGDWTGSFTPSGTGSITMADNTGHYVKEGNKVTISGLFTVASVSSPTGHLMLNLPFPGATGAKYRQSVVVNMEGLPSTFNSQVMATIQSTGVIYITKLLNGAAVSMAHEVQAGTAVFVSATYFTN